MQYVYNKQYTLKMFCQHINFKVTFVLFPLNAEKKSQLFCIFIVFLQNKKRAICLRTTLRKRIATVIKNFMLSYKLSFDYNLILNFDSIIIFVCLLMQQL